MPLQGIVTKTDSVSRAQIFDHSYLKLWSKTLTVQIQKEYDQFSPKANALLKF